MSPRWAFLIRIAACVTTLLALAAPPALAEEQTHLFDATLSLTGDCSTNATVDPVPDPGCPGGEHPPMGPFKTPLGIAVDPHGNRYISSYGNTASEGRIDVFGPDGNFITEVADDRGANRIAVDSEGNIYLHEHKAGEGRLVVFEPTKYEPAKGEIEYGDPPSVVLGVLHTTHAHLDVNRANDHLFVNAENRILEFNSNAEGNQLVDETIGQGIVQQGKGIAVDAVRNRIYAAGIEMKSIGEHWPTLIRVFDLQPPHALVQTIDGSTLPSGSFSSELGALGLAVDEATGRLFVGDLTGSKRGVYVLESDGTYVGAIQKAFQDVGAAQLGFDNGATSPRRGYLYVPSNPGTPGRSLAFAPKVAPKPPLVESLSFAEVTETEAVLRAVVNPNGQQSSYRFEYTTQERFEEEGFAGATVAGAGTLEAATEGSQVATSVTGLEPGGTYRLRVVAQSEAGEAERQRPLATFAPREPSEACPNEALRTGASAGLPDCRAYELVSPSNTNGRTPTGLGSLGHYFTSRHVSPAGEEVSFFTEGGSIPGFEGTGSFAGDPYLSRRTPQGWVTESVGPDGVESPALLPGAFSPDQGYSFWEAEGDGSATVGGENTRRVRYPDGHSEVLGAGTLALDPEAEGQLIAPNGSHIVFTSKVQLESAAPPDGTEAIYDRTPDGTVHVVSLLPEDITPEAKSNALYEGASLDGRGIAFRFVRDTGGPTPIYLRRDNAETFLAAPPEAKFAGVAEGGARLFYVHEGDLFAFDAETQEAVPFSESGDVTVVNVSADGTAAYLVSPSVPGEEGFGPVEREENPRGDLPQPGAHNLYLSEEGAISFVGTVTKRDVEGEFKSTENAGGLGLWRGHSGRIAADPSRTTPDGEVLLFESRANLTGFDPEGHAQVFRYDSQGEVLDCLSCNPTLAPPSADAILQPISHSMGAAEPANSFVTMSNLRADGKRVFFQSPEGLVLADTDGLLDVYQWEAEGVGGCDAPAGCIDLISSGQSARPDYLYGASEDGNRVFFRTADLLMPALDRDETPSLFAASVGGGFPEPSPPASECLGEACQPVVSPPPDPIAGVQGKGNVTPTGKRPRCPKGKRLVKKGGKRRCVRIAKPRKRRGAKRRAGR